MRRAQGVRQIGQPGVTSVVVPSYHAPGLGEILSIAFSSSGLLFLLFCDRSAQSSLFSFLTFSFIFKGRYMQGGRWSAAVLQQLCFSCFVQLFVESCKYFLRYQLARQLASGGWLVTKVRLHLLIFRNRWASCWLSSCTSREALLGL